ncbi:MAG: hypothetical protein KAH72_00495, partial [Flavobacteriaceae bacterium]|nr:hypothetical protein [Flavobacteriaceae bacterium]
FLGITFSINAQDKYGSDPNKCKTNLSIFYEYAKVGNYTPAYEPWNWCMENCPASSKNLYKYGIKMAEDKYDKASSKTEKAKFAVEINKIYEQRIKYFPENLGKVYSDWANFLFKRAVQEEIAQKEQIYDKLGKSFKADPTGMSVKNLGKYFQVFTEHHKDTNPQLVFDTYDEIIEAVSTKMDNYSKELDDLNNKEASGQTLSAKDDRKKHAREVNLKALGQVEGLLDNTLSEVATCERLIPLYNQNFEKNKTDVKWMRRAVSRLNQKGCTDDALYPKMVEAYVNAAPSSDAYVFYAGILMGKNRTNEAIDYFNKAISLESDKYKKAKYYYRAALIYKKRGAKSKAREYARKALKERPSMGSAYLLISNLYASSANTCGTDEFSKRMVYVAAADKARQAKAADPGITSTANKYIKSYMGSAPSKKLIFTEGKASGTAYKIGCWIGETVRIP